MNRKGVELGILFLAFLTANVYSSQYKVVGESRDLYFGHISYVEIKNDGQDPVVFREGMKAPDLAVLNLPLGPGDVIQTTALRRCEVQFDNGTIVRLDFNTRLKIETILAQSLSTAKKMSNLLLAGGQVYVMYKKYDSLEIFQIITPHAAVKLNHNSVAFIQLKDRKTEVQVERGKANLLSGPDKFHTLEKGIEPQQRLIVGADNAVLPAEYVPASDFKAWNEQINANFKELHDANLLPKPIQNLPKAVWYFAQNYGNIHGEWIWHDLYGYVWRPYINDFRYPWGGWQPYMYGTWTGYQDRLFWVPGEPWGWIPYHLGIWMWDKNKGWLWLPGSFFAPAWVDWEFFFGDYFWRPYSLFDWYDWWPDYYFDIGFLYGNTALSGPGGTTPYRPRQTQPVRTVVSKDQLKKKTEPSLPMPKELKSAYKATAAALKRGDERVLASLREVPRQSVIISKSDFGSPRWQEKVISRDQFAKQAEVASRAGQTPAHPRSEYVARDALRRYETIRAITEVIARMGVRDKNSTGDGAAVPRNFSFDPERRALPPDAVIQRPGERNYQPAPAAPDLRSLPVTAAPQPALWFRDWNPDIRTAVRLGVDISYSSRTNEVYAPQLGLRSRDVSPTFRLSPETYQSISSGSFGGGSAVQGSSGAPAGQAGSGGGSAHGESGKAGGEAKKN